MTPKDVLAEDAEQIPYYINQGFSKKIEYDLWRNFVTALVPTFDKLAPGSGSDTKLRAEKFNSVLGACLPLFALQMKGKLGVDLNTQAVSDILKIPKAEIANTNVWELMQGFSAWGTTDDMELIRMTENEVDSETAPIWANVDGHENFQTPNEALNALVKVFIPFFGNLSSSGSPYYKTLLNQKRLIYFLYCLNILR